MQEDKTSDGLPGDGSDCLPEGSSLFDFHQKVSRAFHLQRACVRPTAVRRGLGSGQPRILSFVAAHGEATQNQIAEFFQIDPAAVSRMLVGLKRSGYVAVRAQPNNRRANTVTLTQAGHETIRVWDRRCAEIERAMLTGFSAREREQFGSYLDRILTNLGEEARHV